VVNITIKKEFTYNQIDSYTLFLRAATRSRLKMHISEKQT